MATSCISKELLVWTIRIARCMKTMIGLWRNWTMSYLVDKRQSVDLLEKVVRCSNYCTVVFLGRGLERLSIHFFIHVSTFAVGRRLQPQVTTNTQQKSEPPKYSRRDISDCYVLQLYRTLYAVRSTLLTTAIRSWLSRVTLSGALPIRQSTESRQLPNAWFPPFRCRAAVAVLPLPFRRSVLPFRCTVAVVL